LRTIGNRSSSITILRDVLNKWSIEQEKKSPFYRDHNGILTNDGKSTTAFPYYIELMINLGFLSKINEVVRASKYGTLFLTLDKFSNSTSFFSDTEKLFYLFFLLQKDADNIILILTMIDENNGSADNTFLRSQYEDYLKQRLKIKANHSKSFSQIAITDKLRQVEHVWQNAKEYSKHIIPPRIEWMVDIGLLKEDNSKRLKSFEFSGIGRAFFNSLEFIDDTNLKDINDIWLMDKFIHQFHDLIGEENEINNFDLLDFNSVNNFLGEILPLAYKELDTDGVRRLSAYPFYVYIMIFGLLKYNLAISFSSLKAKLSQSFSTEEYTFAFREASRVNESYLTVSIN
jgi:hypothetical protein